ncbi:hypothetical protein Tco_1484584, partial [Tanacetum coccineum]
KPTTLHEAINKARELVEQVVQGKAARVSESNKRKWEDHQKNNPNNNNKNQNRNNNHHQQQNRRQETARAYAAAPVEGRVYVGNLPKCNRIGATYIIMDRALQNARDIKGWVTWRRIDTIGTGVPRQGTNRLRELVRELTRWLKIHSRIRMWSRAHFYLMITMQVSYLIRVLREALCPLSLLLFIDIAPTALIISYEVELADGKVVSTNTVLCGCSLALFNQVFKIELLPTRLGSFDVIVGIDWLSYHRVVIVCYERIVRIPILNGEILEVQGERPEKDLRSLLCIKANEKKLDDIHIVRDFLEVFPDDLAGLPPVREIEFCIELIPGALPLVKSPYRLAPSEMLELSTQLKELQEKGFLLFRQVIHHQQLAICQE